MTGFVHIIFIVIGFIISLFIVFKKETELYLKFFSPFLLIAAIVELVGFELGRHKISNAKMYNIFSAFEFVFYFWVVGLIIKNEKIKQVLKSFLFIYPLIFFLEYVFSSVSTGFYSVTYSIGSFFIIIFCVYYFFELFQLPHSIKLVNEPSFWICSGLLFFYTCTFPLFGMANYLKLLPRILMMNLWVIVYVLNILLYSSFAIAFLCRLKVRKYSS